MSLKSISPQEELETEMVKCYDVQKKKPQGAPIYGLENVDGINKIQFNELATKKKRGGSKINSEKQVGVIPPYTLTNNSNSLLKMNPY